MEDRNGYGASGKSLGSFFVGSPPHEKDIILGNKKEGADRNRDNHSVDEGD